MKIFLILLILLPGCTSMESAAPTQNKEGTHLNVTVYAVRTESDLNDIAPEPAYTLKGQTVYELNGDNCRIYIIRPRVFKIDGDYTMTLGHELMHCLYGDYH